MPRGNPSYRLHRSSAQAVVTLHGRDIYLGLHGSPESHARYAAAMRSFRDGRPAEAIAGPSGISVAEGVLIYCDYARRYYRDDRGNDTRQFPRIRRALGTLVELYASVTLADIGARELRDVQGRWVAQGLGRTYANHLLVATKTAFKWLVREGYYPANKWVEIQLVAGLKFGRTSAHESTPTVCVPEGDLEATRPHMPEIIASMVDFQLLTGSRSGEVVGLTWEQIDRSGPIWVYRPSRHKNKWRGQPREIMIGPKAQAVIFGRQSISGPVFQHSGGIYTVQSYAKAIARICRRAGVPVWRPGQLRHNAATRIQGELGWDVARAVLGHRTVETTRIYADRDAAAAAEAARRLG
jgi:integrase